LTKEGGDVLQGIKPTMVEKSNNIEVYMHLLKNLKLLHQVKNEKKHNETSLKFDINIKASRANKVN
jgi:hypothetical protein